MYAFEPGQPPLLTGEAFLDHAREAGYDGVVLGPPGFIGDAHWTRGALERRGLLLAGAYLDRRFSRRESIAKDLPGLVEYDEDFLAAGFRPAT